MYVLPRLKGDASPSQVCTRLSQLTSMFRGMHEIIETSLVVTPKSLWTVFCFSRDMNHVRESVQLLQQTIAVRETE